MYTRILLSSPARIVCVRRLKSSVSQYEWTSIWFLFPKTEVFSIWKMTLKGTVTPPPTISCACEMYILLSFSFIPGPTLPQSPTTVTTYANALKKKKYYHSLSFSLSLSRSLCLLYIYMYIIFSVLRLCPLTKKKNKYIYYIRTPHNIR